MRCSSLVGIEECDGLGSATTASGPQREVRNWLDVTDGVDKTKEVARPHLAYLGYLTAFGVARVTGPQSAQAQTLNYDFTLTGTSPMLVPSGDHMSRCVSSLRHFSLVAIYRRTAMGSSLDRDLPLFGQ